jgi:uncharacterized membrane protein (DUF4010 family)
MAERLAIAALVGLAAGVEREWSGPVSGPTRRFAGLRTFLMFGLLGGTAGLLLASNEGVSAAALLAGGAAFIIAAYVVAVRRPEQPLDGTTEGAALVVLGLGVLAGLGHLGLAAGSVAVVVFALGEKERLHWLVGRIGQTEMHATLQFLVLALVILPLLPTGPYASLWDFRPRALWSIVVLLSGLNFVGYLGQRAVGVTRGYVLTGLLGGIVSSTAVTLQFSRRSRTAAENGTALGLGVVAACSVVPIRVLLLSLVLSPALARALLPYLLPSMLAGLGMIVFSLRHPSPPAGAPPEARSPLRFGSAVQMALLFQVALIAIGYARSAWGSGGLLGSAILLGIADADALTISMHQVARATNATSLAAHGVAIGVLAGMLFKLLLAASVGTGALRRWTMVGLGAMAAALGAATWLAWGP